MFTSAIKPIRILCLAALVVALFCLLVWISAAMTIGISNLAGYLGGALGNYLLDHGVARIMRRILMFWAIVVFALSLRKLGWQGWKDCGWIGGSIPVRFSQFGWGIVFGLISMGSIAVITVFAGVHRWKTPDDAIPAIAGTILLFAVSGLVVALIEETVFRGILFRVLARRWTAWSAAVAINTVFAMAHFIGPETAKFHGNSFMAASLKATLSTLASLIPPQNALIQFFNLILLGVLLCVFVMRTKTIWMSVGAHAAWVFVIKIHSCFTVLNAGLAPCFWMGKRNDFLDSPITAFVLLAFILLFSRWTPRLHAQCPGLDNSPARDEDFFADAEILKKYPGCLVVKKGGLVFKKYFPKNTWNKIMFAFHPLRSKRAFLLSENLIECGLPTPPVLGWTARRFGKDQYEAMLVTEVQNAEPLTDWLARNIKDTTTRLRVMEAYGKLMADFHCHGYSNRDLKHENVMCSKETPWLLQVVDLDGVHKKTLITRRRAGKDLFRIGDSLASLGWNHADEIAAFFKAYNAKVPPRLRFRSFPFNAW